MYKTTNVETRTLWKTILIHYLKKDVLYIFSWKNE